MTTWMGIPIGGDYPLDEEKDDNLAQCRAENERLKLALWETQAVADGLLEHATVKQLRARVAELEGALRDIVKWGMDEQMTIIARAALEGKP